MPRAARINAPDTIQHVTVRGNRRQAIYLDTLDRRRFLDDVAIVVERFRWISHAYCEMTNHFHLVVETPEPNLSAGMHTLNSRYAHWFNARHALDGHLFERRFDARLIESQLHLLDAARYVVLNPVRAGFCRDAEDWPWSSYRATAGTAARAAFLTTDWILGLFGNDRRRAATRYEEFVRDGAELYRARQIGRAPVPGTRTWREVPVT